MELSQSRRTSKRRSTSTTESHPPKRSATDQHFMFTELAEWFRLVNVAPGTRLEYFRKRQDAFRKSWTTALKEVMKFFVKARDVLVELQNKHRLAKTESDKNTMHQVYTRMTFEEADYAHVRMDVEWVSMEKTHQDSFQELLDFARRSFDIIKTASKSMTEVEDLHKDFYKTTSLSTMVYTLQALMETALEDVKAVCSTMVAKLFEALALLNTYRVKHDLQRKAEIATRRKSFRLPGRLGSIMRRNFRRGSRKMTEKEIDELKEIQIQEELEQKIIDVECAEMQRQVNLLQNRTDKLRSMEAHEANKHRIAQLEEIHARYNEDYLKMLHDEYN